MKMTDNENSVVDPSILFGGSANPPAAKPDDSNLDIPAFLKRGDTTTTVTPPAIPEGMVEPDQDRPGFVDGNPVFTTQVDDATGQTEVVVEQGTQALISNAPSQIEAAQAEGAHSDPHAGEVENERATIGGNQPPEEPATKEEMLKDMWKDIGAYGKASGAGAAALPRLGLRVIRAAADGLISNEKPKDGSKSDAVRIYERYAEQDSKHSEHSKGGMKANAAKLNALIGLGCMTTVDGVEIADRAVKLREKMEAEELKPKALFAGLVDVARAQMEEDQPLTDDAILGALGKTVKDKSVEDEWAAIYKKVEKLVTGENPAGIKDDSDRAMKIAEQINEHIKNFATAAADEEQVAWCMERGMSREQAQAFVAART